jgi:hypothetical protein
LDKIPDQLFDRSDDYTYEIPKPNFEMLEKIFKFYLGKYGNLSEKEFNAIMRKIKDFSPRQIEKLVIKSRLFARIRMGESKNSEAKLEITSSDLIEVLKELNQSKVLRAKSTSTLKKLEPYWPAIGTGIGLLGLGGTVIGLYLHNKGLLQAWRFGTFGPFVGLVPWARENLVPWWQKNYEPSVSSFSSEAAQSLREDFVVSNVSKGYEIVAPVVKPYANQALNWSIAFVKKNPVTKCIVVGIVVGIIIIHPPAAPVAAACLV